ncbi:MAG: SGNH/GDSL hydrolase family protein [Rhodospirillales bacterium]|nr:SGNH/GDSL hydrolase family protein [Rhodospirillales bacterium]MBO6786018.1 SGNH/GDSL hydrolase family protein [Rhodospirillales bacterium]
MNVQPLRDDFKYDSIDIDNPRFIANDQSGYENRPNIMMELVSTASIDGETFNIRTPVRHAGDGARIPMSGPLDAASEVKVVAVGGSQTWGQGVKAEQTFSSVFASHLSIPNRNYGVSGSGGASSYFILKQKLAKISPKYVLYGFWEDHMNRNLRYCANNKFPVCSPLAYVSGTRENDFVLNPAKNSQVLIEDLGDFFRDMQRRPSLIGLPKDMYWTHRRLLRQLDEAINPLAYDKAPVERKIAASQFVLKNMAELTRKAGASLIVVYIPLYFSDTIEAANSVFLKTAKENKFVFVDTTEVLRDMKEKNVPVFIEGDGHLSVSAHRAIAKEILSRVGRSGSGR